VDDGQRLHDEAGRLLATYHECLGQLGIDESLKADQLSFNMYVTRNLMFIVKRACNSVQSADVSEAIVDINTLGFAGTLAVKNQASLDFLKAETPINLLNKVAL